MYTAIQVNVACRNHRVYVRRVATVSLQPVKPRSVKNDSGVAEETTYMKVSSSMWISCVILHQIYACDSSIHIFAERIWQWVGCRQSFFVDIFRRGCRCIPVSIAPRIVCRIASIRIARWCTRSPAIHWACGSGRLVNRVSIRVVWVGHISPGVRSAIVLTRKRSIRNLSDRTRDAALITCGVTAMPMIRAVHRMVGTARRVSELLAGSTSHIFHISRVPRYAGCVVVQPVSAAPADIARNEYDKGDQYNEANKPKNCTRERFVLQEAFWRERCCRLI